MNDSHFSPLMWDNSFYNTQMSMCIFVSFGFSIQFIGLSICEPISHVFWIKRLYVLMVCMDHHSSFFKPFSYSHIFFSLNILSNKCYNQFFLFLGIADNIIIGITLHWTVNIRRIDIFFVLCHSNQDMERFPVYSVYPCVF